MRLTLLVCCCCLLAESRVLAEETALTGLDSINVVVEDLDDDALARGLSRETIITDVELQLRMAGLTVLPSVELPYLYVRASVLKRTDLDHFVWKVEANLKEIVYVPRARVYSYATVWYSTGKYGICPGNELEETVRKEVRDRVNQFLNAWLEVNPLKTR